jgi:hypothetical protein
VRQIRQIVPAQQTETRRSTSARHDVPTYSDNLRKRGDVFGRFTVTGLELIIAALVAGAATGTSAMASTAINDAYAGLRGVLRSRLAARRGAQELDAHPSDDPAVWEARIAEDVVESGADRDDQVLAAAQQLLGLADSTGSRAGKYVVTVAGSDEVQIGDGNVRVGTAYGPTVGTMTGPMTLNYGQDLPPGRPTAR